MSTAILPGAFCFDASHPTGMKTLLDVARIIQVIQARLKDMGTSEDKISRESGHPDAIRNMRRGHHPKAGVLLALDKVLGFEPGHLGRQASTTAQSAAVPPAAGPELTRLHIEIDRLLRERDLIDRKIEGIRHAVSVLEVGKPSRAPRKPKKRLAKKVAL
jgi:hypothetical protein